jgi:hypothetical protein
MPILHEGASQPVSDVDRYVSIRKLLVSVRFSGIDTSVGNSNILTEKFLSVRLFMFRQHLKLTRFYFLAFIRRWEIETYLHRTFFCSIRLLVQDTPWFIEYMDFTRNKSTTPV